MNAIKKYMTKIEWSLRTDRATRTRIMLDLSGGVQGRLEAGETPEAIIADMGAPCEVAAPFNAEYAAQHGVYRSPLRWAVLAALAAVVLWGIVQLVLALLFTRQMLFGGAAFGGAAFGGESTAIIGGADGPTAVFVTTNFGASTLLGYLPPVLGLAALFCLLQWPRGAAHADRARIVAAVLAVCGLLAWAATQAANGVALWQFLDAAPISGFWGRYALGVLERFFTGGAFLSAIALWWALKRKAKV